MVLEQVPCMETRWNLLRGYNRTTVQPTVDWIIPQIFSEEPTGEDLENSFHVEVQGIVINCSVFWNQIDTTVVSYSKRGNVKFCWG